MAQQSTNLPAIEAEIERIRSLGLDALRARWRSMFGAMPPVALTKDLIARMMIYRIQEEAFGGLDRSTRKLLDGMAQGEKPCTDVKRRLKAGTVLVREYQGERHTVTLNFGRNPGLSFDALIVRREITGWRSSGAANALASKIRRCRAIGR